MKVILELADRAVLLKPPGWEVPKGVQVWSSEDVGLSWDNGKENGNFYNGLYTDYIGIMEKKMETTIAYWS